MSGFRASHIIAGLASLLVVSAVVLQVSDAAFADTTMVAGSTWAAGTVSIVDSDGDAAMFGSGPWRPGQSQVECLEVTYTGSVAPSSPVTLSAEVTELVVAGDGLGNDIAVTVDLAPPGQSCAAWVDAGTYRVFSGTLASMTVPGSTSWIPTLPADEHVDGVGDGDVMRAFWVTATLDADVDDSAQGEGASAAFLWGVTN